MNPKAQTWSVDIILAVIIFMGAFFIFYALLYENSGTKVSSLKEEASIIIKQVSAGGSLRILNKNEINISKVNELKNLSYEELKQRLRVEGDFCIYIEDENGNLVLINNSYKGIGSSSINISGTPCSQK